MKLKIISDGTLAGTKVVNAETGETVEGCYYVDWHCHIDNNHIGAVIWLRDVAIEVVTDNVAAGIAGQTKSLPLYDGKP